MKVDLPWLSIEKPAVIDLDKLDIRVPYGVICHYTLSLMDKTQCSGELRHGLIELLVKCGVVNSRDPIKILKAIEKMPGEQGKKLIRSALEGTMPVKEVVNE